MPATLMAVTGPVLGRILGWLILTACLPVAVLPETRVWQAGGSPALAARGKCWLDGECVLGSGSWSDERVGGQWLSQDDVEESYQHLGVGRDENACLARAKHYHAQCGNNMSSPILATYVPSGATAFYPQPASAADFTRHWEAVYALRRLFCIPRSAVASCPWQDAHAEALAAAAAAADEAAIEIKEWIFNRLVGVRDFSLLRSEVEYLTEIGYCLNHDAMYKWSVIMRTVGVLQRSGLLPTAGIESVDIGGGSAPLQFFMAERGHVTNIDINFMSSWFPTDAQGFYMRSNPRRLAPTLTSITRAEGDLVAELGKLQEGSVDVVYDACSFIHMWGRYPTLQDGLAVGMDAILRVLKPGGFFIAVSDVAHPDGQEMREFVYAEHLAGLFSHGGLLEFVSEPRFYLPEGVDELVLGDKQSCVPIESAWHKPNMTSHVLSAASVHTCEEMPQGQLRLLVANFVLRKPLAAD